MIYASRGAQGARREGVNRTSSDPPFPGCPGVSQSSLPAGFSCRRALDCSIKEQGKRWRKFTEKSRFRYTQVIHCQCDGEQSVNNLWVTPSATGFCNALGITLGASASDGMDRAAGLKHRRAW